MLHAVPPVVTGTADVGPGVSVDGALPRAASQSFCLEPRCPVKTGPGAQGPLWLIPGLGTDACFSLAASVSPLAYRLPGGGVLRLGVGSRGAGGWWGRGVALGESAPQHECPHRPGEGGRLCQRGGLFLPDVKEGSGRPSLCKGRTDRRLGGRKAERRL